MTSTFKSPSCLLQSLGWKLIHRSVHNSDERLALLGPVVVLCVHHMGRRTWQLPRNSHRVRRQRRRGSGGRAPPRERQRASAGQLPPRPQPHVRRIKRKEDQRARISKDVFCARSPSSPSPLEPPPLVVRACALVNPLARDVSSHAIEAAAFAGVYAGFIQIS
jgi:hypothetical protein